MTATARSWPSTSRDDRMLPLAQVMASTCHAAWASTAATVAAGLTEVLESHFPWQGRLHWALGAWVSKFLDGALTMAQIPPVVSHSKTRNKGSPCQEPSSVRLFYAQLAATRKASMQNCMCGSFKAESSKDLQVCQLHVA